ncbi:MAG TPA: glycoside hydrolase family 3 C-terminal domain-containing protein, partial [Mycobacteriales bacterium]
MATIDPDAVLAALSLEQKASLTSGSDFWHTEPITAAGVPAIMVADGPHGLRKQPDSHDAIGLSGSVPATCFPPAVALGSTWDTALVERVGAAIAREALASRVSVVLGPGVNIKRSPLCGRNFEYVSEDPHLAGRIGAAWVTGLQAQGVGASLKHFAVNNQETDRMRVSADVDERTLREIYLPAFEYVVRTTQPWTVMSSYNRLNGTYTSEHRHLLTEILREEWGFRGLIVSDWGAVDDRVRSLAAGLDLEMPPSASDGEIAEAVRAGDLEVAALDDAARRVLRLVAAGEAALAGAEPFDVDAHDALAREAATAAAVLLKNDGILPLSDTGTQRIAVVGELARRPRYQGAGSSKIVPTRLDNALDAIVATAGADRVRFAPGYGLDGVPDAALVADAVAAAAEADVVVAFLGLPAAAESEGFDRDDIDLPAAQLALLEDVARTNPDVAVVLSNGGVVSVAEWQHSARAVLEGWLLGQAGGRATADLLFGHANPSGRLTETIPLRLEDSPAHLYFPGGDQHVRYGEGIYVGYRHFDTLGCPVAYPFGHGLSYTTFEVADLVVTTTGPNVVNVTVSVTNSGDVAGAEVVAIYVHDSHAAVDRPEQELKGFAKVHLAPGERRAVTVTLDETAFRYWAPGQRRWVVDAGSVEVRILRADRSVSLRTTVELPGDGVLPPLDVRSTIDEWVDHPVGGPLLDAAMTAAGGMTLD